ncbi:MAG: cupin domain-containing protein [Bacteroides sp.]|nr:cupin domain-containing protein [Bacteroidales bacterium]MBD5379335.1 cupin domain-containing protein [Bacteroides sp.]MDE5808932.1 cupin domain-containing protein [Muribaculaceae bacterium]MDE6224772.1 cupin domain-containing protein [Muribaculaceae bacterium]
MLETEFKFGEVYKLTDQIEDGADRVHFKNIFSNNNGGVSLLAFKKGQKLDTHTAPAEVMVTVLEGSIEFTMLDKPHTLMAGQFLLMGEAVPHSVVAKTDSKVMLTKLKA